MCKRKNHYLGNNKTKSASPLGNELKTCNIFASMWGHHCCGIDTGPERMAGRDGILGIMLGFS